MDRIEELLTKLTKAENTGTITIGAEHKVANATYEQIYTDPQEVLEVYQSLKRNGWALTELRIEHISMPQFESAFKEEKKEEKKDEKPERNEDHYRETILRERDKGREVSCIVAGLRGKKDCDAGECIDCMDDSMEWLYKEYRENVLKDGRDLKPGTWIMVRDSDDGPWVKRQFMCYINNRFYTVNDGSIPIGKPFAVVDWKQVRLPMEGE